MSDHFGIDLRKTTLDEIFFEPRIKIVFTETKTSNGEKLPAYLLLWSGGYVQKFVKYTNTSPRHAGSLYHREINDIRSKWTQYWGSGQDLFGYQIAPLDWFHNEELVLYRLVPFENISHFDDLE